MRTSVRIIFSPSFGVLGRPVKVSSRGLQIGGDWPWCKKFACLGAQENCWSFRCAFRSGVLFFCCEQTYEGHTSQFLVEGGTEINRCSRSPIFFLFVSFLIGLVVYSCCACGVDKNRQGYVACGFTKRQGKLLRNGEEAYARKYIKSQVSTQPRNIYVL